MKDNKETPRGNPRLIAARQQRGLAQVGLAVLAHVSPGLICGAERHGYIPCADVRERLAAALGVAAGALWPAPLDC